MKNKIFSMINILGLAVGVACCALLALYVQDEFGYEKSVPERGRLYRIYTVFVKDGMDSKFPRTSPPIAIDLMGLLPEVETATRIFNSPTIQQHILQYHEKVFYEKSGAVVDSTFFRMFPYYFSVGDQRKALDAPSSVVLSEKLARKIFGDQNPIDELITINSGQAVDTFHVTGVIKANPYPSHADAEFYMGMNNRGGGRGIRKETTWAWNNYISSYLLLKPGSDVAAVEKKINDELERRAGNDLRGVGMKKSLHLQPLDEIRLYSDFTDTFGDMGKGTITYVYMLTAVGMFILCIACINFMNLTTARATQRAGEVGIRKSMGAFRSTLIRQFLGESFTIVAAALVFAFFLLLAALPIVNVLADKHMVINSGNIFYLLGAMLTIGVVTGLLAGSYPAFVLSSFEPARVLKNKIVTSGRNSWLRQGLVIFQFVIAITLISSILILQEQMRFIRSTPLGFKDENVIMIPMRSSEISKNFLSLRDEFKRVVGVREVSGTSSLPSTPVFMDNAFYPQGSSMEKAILTRIIEVDEDYFKLLGIDLVSGRDVHAPMDTMSYKSLYAKVIVNEATLKAYGINPESAIGTRVFQDDEKKVRTLEIIGVVQDFHQLSMHQNIYPIIFRLPVDRNRYPFMAVSIDGPRYAEVIKEMQKAWHRIIPDMPFETELLSDSVDRQYENDDRIATMLTGSTILAIVISCLGLYGLSIFVAERRIREIGIRKVLGASVSGIVTMLSRDFIILVAIAFVIAAPIAYYVMEQWLKGFAFRTHPGVMVFATAGLVSVLIAWITIGFESVRAAIGNPINALRSE